MPGRVVYFKRLHFRCASPKCSRTSRSRKDRRNSSETIEANDDVMRHNERDENLHKTVCVWVLEDVGSEGGARDRKRSGAI